MPRKKKEEEVEPVIRATMDIGGESLSVGGSSIEECLSLIKPKHIKGKAIFRVEKGEKTFQRIFFPFQVKRLLVNKIYRQIVDKQMKVML